MMASSLAQDTGSQEATDKLSFGVLGHQEHAESHHIFRPEVLADGKYAQVHSVQDSQGNVCGIGHSAPQVQVHTANLACLRPPPFMPGGAHAEVAPTKAAPASNAIDQPIWSSPVLEPNSRHLPTEVSHDLVSQYPTGLKQMPPPDHTLRTDQTLAPVPAPQPVASAEFMDLQQEQQSHPEEGGPAQFAELDQVPPNAESQDHSTSASDRPRAVPVPPRSRVGAICSGDTAAGPALISNASCLDLPPPAPAPPAAGSAATDAAPTPVNAGDRSAGRPADPAKVADSEDSRDPAAAGSVAPQPPTGLKMEGLAIVSAPEVYGRGGGAVAGPGPTATKGTNISPAAGKAVAVESGAAVPSPSEAIPASGAGPPDARELPVIGSVLLSGDRLVFRCTLCPELFSSAGRLRTHHGLQHCPQPAAAPSPIPPAPSPAAGRRRGRPPRSAAAAASAVVTAVAADDGDSPDACDPAFKADEEDDAFPGLRRTRSGRTRVPLTPVSLKCDICGKVLSSGNKLAVHQRMHSGERPHVCTYCPKRCNDMGNLRKHEQLHFKPRPFRCGTCGITFWTALRQRAHRCKLSPGSTGRRIAADEVDVSENGQETAVGEGAVAESLEVSAEGLDEDPLKLNQALGGLPALAAAAELAGTRPRREPSPERQPNVNSGLVPVVPVDCDVCGRRLRSISGWQRHRRLHAGVRPYQCRFCDKTCNDSGNMRKHEAGHFKERPYRCDTCSITFINAWRLGLHQCKMRADGGTTAAGGNTAPVPAPAAAAAEVEVEAALESRPPLPVPPPRGRHAPPPQLDARGRRRDHVCPVCNKALLSYASLEMHYRTHTGEKPYQCDECGQRFSIQGNLVVHARIHTGERPFQCEECGKMFMYQSHLKVHKRGHSGERPYQCQFCHKGFAASSSKRVHEETVHSTERKFICEACGVAFKEKKHLKRHSLKKHQMGGEAAV